MTGRGSEVGNGIERNLRRKGLAARSGVAKTSVLGAVVVVVSGKHAALGPREHLQCLHFACHLHEVNRAETWQHTQRTSNGAA